jgi:hypothetical protein
MLGDERMRAQALKMIVGLPTRKERGQEYVWLRSVLPHAVNIDYSRERQTDSIPRPLR